MTRPSYTEIVVLLDRSGSMATLKNDMEGGFDTFIQTQKSVPGECRVSLFQFDDQFEVVYAGMALNDVPKLSLIPRGSTALWDALGKSIVLTGERYRQMPDIDRPSKVIFVVITDGQENCSREYSLHRIKEVIKHQEDKYQWSFVYLGSSPTTQQDAAVMGLRNAASYVASAGGVRGMSNVVGNAVASYRSSAAPASATAVMDWMPASIPEEPAPPYVVGHVDLTDMAKDLADLMNKAEQGSQGAKP